MKIDHEVITNKIETVRTDLGCQRVLYTPVRISLGIDEDLPPGTRINTLFHESGLLIRRGQPVFAYIRDHTIGSFLTPFMRKKIHFTACQKLREMKAGGRFSRYKVINRDSNIYPIDISNTVEREVSLYPCQFCLEEVGYHCFSMGMSKKEKRTIVEKFDAREALPLLRQQFEIFKEVMKDARSAMLPTGYPKNWPKISHEIRQSRKFICEICSVNLSAHPRLTDAHHIDGDKTNIRSDNLLCLCKICHSEQPQHSHYRVSDNDRQIIERERREQGISKEAGL